MQNDTDSTASSTTAGAFLVVPIFLGVMFYLSSVLALWPYARPIVPIYLLFLSILVPPLFPLLLVYVLFCAVPLRPVTAPRGVTVREVIIVEASARGRVRTMGPTSATGHRV
jgi:hypothetical protein